MLLIQTITVKRAITKRRTLVKVIPKERKVAMVGLVVEEDEMDDKRILKTKRTTMKEISIK